VNWRFASPMHRASPPYYLMPVARRRHRGVGSPRLGAPYLLPRQLTRCPSPPRRQRRVCPVSGVSPPLDLRYRLGWCGGGLAPGSLSASTVVRLHAGPAPSSVRGTSMEVLRIVEDTKFRNDGSHGTVSPWHAVPGRCPRKRSATRLITRLGSGCSSGQSKRFDVPGQPCGCDRPRSRYAGRFTPGPGGLLSVLRTQHPTVADLWLAAHFTPYLSDSPATSEISAGPMGGLNAGTGVPAEF